MPPFQPAAAAFMVLLGLAGIAAAAQAAPYCE